MFEYRNVDIGAGVTIGSSTKIWDYSQIRDNVQIGERVIIGRAVYIGSGVKIGDDCKIQNQALIYEPSILERGVFVGPGVIFTNDKFPRAITASFRQKTIEDWKAVGVHVGQGASIGARVVCVAPIDIGQWAMIAAGSIVTKNVPDFSLMAGAPARRVGWVGRLGEKLAQDLKKTNEFICISSEKKYIEVDSDTLIEKDNFS